MEQKTLLITGFEPFQQGTINPSWEAVALLPETIGPWRLEKLRLPVELYYLEGFKTREIAGMLGIPENTVKTRLRAAREHLRKDLKGACFA